MRLSIIVLLVASSAVAQTSGPTDARGWLNMGVQAYRSARYADAVEDFRKAVELDPSNVNAHLYLATTYMSMYIPGAESAENHAYAEQAKAEFQRVLELSPSDKTALSSLASLSYQERKLDESRDWNLKLLAVDPQAKEAYYTLGVIGWLKWYPAYRDARSRLGLQPEAPGPLPDSNTRQQLNLEYGQVIADAMANLDKALAIDPQYDDAMAYTNLLIRERADLRDSADEYKQDVAAADEWVKKTLDTKRMKAQNGISSSSTGPPPPPPPPPPATGNGERPQRIRVGVGVLENNLLYKVNPVYPPLAKQARIQGTVRFTAIISKDGQVTNLQLVSGHPLLVQAAQDAVKQWVYKPTLLNGEPVEVVTQLDVSFNLSR